MRRPPHLLYLLLALLCLGACAAHKGLAVGYDRTLAAADPPPTLPGRTYTQSFVVSRRGADFRFTGHVELEHDRLAVVGLTPVGSRGFAAVWTRAGLSYDAIPFYRLPLAPDELLVAWQLAWLTPEELQPLLSPARLALTETDTAPRERTLSADGRTLARVRYDAAGTHAVVEFFSRGFTLTMTTASVAPLDPLD